MVTGSGGAGLNAAMTLIEPGLRVVLVESGPAVGGTIAILTGSSLFRRSGRIKPFSCLTA
jgi:heterodisulfide reductase subunit A-like polyferredoxin